MPVSDFLDARWYGNSTRQWLIAAGVLVASYVLLAALRKLVSARLATLAARTDNIVDDLFLGIVRATRNFFILVAAFTIAWRFLVLPRTMTAGLMKLLVLAGLAQAALWANAAIGFWIENYLRKRQASADSASVSTIQALGIGAKVLVWAVILLTALNNVGVNVTTLITGLGVGGIALALAVQNILGDLLAALAIVFDKPFDVGDFIVVDTISGTVEHIGLKTTRVRSLSGEQVVISNNELLKSRIRNYKRMYERRVVFTLDVTYDTPPDLLAAIPQTIRETVVAQQPVRFDRSHFSSFMDSSLRVETVYWVLTPDYNQYMDIQQTINLVLLRRFAEQGIRFAFPSRSVYVEGGSVPVTTGS